MRWLGLLLSSYADCCAALGGSDAWSAVVDFLPGEDEFAEVHADHLGDDFDWFVVVAFVDVDGFPDELWEDDHVSEVCADVVAFAEVLDQADFFFFEAAVDFASLPCW